MALQIRRGTEAERIAGGGVVFSEGELIYITDTDALYIGDGSTGGGVFLTNNAVGTIGNFIVADTIADDLKLQKNLNLNNNNIIGIGNINIDGNIVATGNINIGDETSDTVTITAQVDSNITPTSDSVYDLGSESLRWRNVYASGLTVDGQIDAVAINANTVADNSSVMVNVATNVFTGDLTGNVTGNVSGNLTGNTTGYHTGDVKGSVFGDDSTPLVDAVEGVLRGNHVGTLSGNILSENGTIILNPGTTGVNANYVGTVQGNVTGNLTGNVSGNVTGDLTGNVTGNTTGYHTGDVKGSVFADGSTLLVDAVAGTIPGENISGTVTASFVGNLQGNVTGDVNASTVLTTVLDTADSSAIVIQPAAIFNSDIIAQNGILIEEPDALTTNFIRAIPGSGSPVFFETNVEMSTNLTVRGDNSTSGLLTTTNSIVVAQIVGEASFVVTSQINNTKADFGVPVKFPVVADDTARSTLVPSPEKGMVILMESGSTPSATNQLQYYDGTNWVNV